MRCTRHAPRRLLPLALAAVILGAAVPATFVGQAVSGAADTADAAMAGPGLQFLYPAAGVVQTVHQFGCNGGVLPNLVERWSCAGKNNNYLLGHAWGVFKPLHDAYAAGKLRVGQVAWFRIGERTRAYAVTWIRVVPKTYVWHGLPGSAWAWNATARPSITLQTCWGTSSNYRVIIRLTSET